MSNEDELRQLELDLEKLKDETAITNPVLEKFYQDGLRWLLNEESTSKGHSDETGQTNDGLAK